MNILQTLRLSRFGQTFTIVMTEGAVNDVAVYEMKGSKPSHEVAAHGTKWTERDCRIAGIEIPAGKHYRR